MSKPDRVKFCSKIRCFVHFHTNATFSVLVASVTCKSTAELVQTEGKANASPLTWQYMLLAGLLLRSKYSS
jgi:hypothetical protein